MRTRAKPACAEGFMCDLSVGDTGKARCAGRSLSDDGRLPDGCMRLSKWELCMVHGSNGGAGQFSDFGAIRASAAGGHWN